MTPLALCVLALLLADGESPPARQIRVHYTERRGDSISIRGSAAPLSWEAGKTAAKKSGDLWIWDIPVSLGGFEFKPFLNDKVGSVGANYSVAANASVDVYPFFGPSKGSLVSHTLKGGRKLVVYLPPSYSENRAKRYPVLHLHDGQNVFEASTSFAGVEWQVDEAMDRLVENGAVREAICVGIYNTADRITEYTPMADSKHGGGGAKAYLDFLEGAVLPLIRASYRTLNGPSNTFLMGSSLGGLVSFYAGWTRSSVYGGVACLSSSFWWSDEALTKAVEKHKGAKAKCRFYLDSGGGEPGADQTERMRDALKSLGADVEHWFDPEGKHNEASWAARVDRPLTFLLRP